MRKSRYAEGGVIGVRRASSFFVKAGVLTIGLINCEGKVPDPGVGNDEVSTLAGLLSNPAAAMVADDVAVAIVGCRRLREEVTEESNE